MGLDGVTVELWADTNGDNVVDTKVGNAVTSAGGQYYFGGATNQNMLAAGATQMVMQSVAASADDAEQTVSSGAVTITSGTLDIPRANGAPQLDGLRFAGLAIPKNAVITNATIQFRGAGGDTNTPVNMRIRAEDSDNATAFAATTNNVSNRTTTTAFVDWNGVPAWSTGEIGADTTTPNLASLVQAVINRPGWTTGNGVSFIVSENGSANRRRASSFDSGNTPPKLTIEYQIPVPVAPRTRYEVRVPTTQPALSGYALSPVDADLTSNGDIRDSDVTQSGSNAVYAFTTGAPGDNDHTIDVGLRNVADVSLTKTVDNPNPQVGTNVTFTITVLNSGPKPATNLIVREPLTDALIYDSHTTTQGTYDPNAGLWTIGTLPVGATATLSVTVVVTRLGSNYKNQAYVQAAGSFDPDSTPGDMTPEDDFAQAMVMPQVVSLARVGEFTCTQMHGGMMLRWRTGSECDNIGFRVTCESDAGGSRIVTHSIVAGSALRAGRSVSIEAGYAYQWMDAAGHDPNARYWLESIALDGSRETYGPATMEPRVDIYAPDANSETLSELGQSTENRSRWQTGWPEPSPASARKTAAASPLQWQLAESPAIKLSVSKPGWYRVTYDDLVAAGVPANRVDPRTLRLYAEGVEQALRITGEDDGRLDPGDTIEFFGRGVDTTWTETRTYWLVAAGAGGKRVRTVASQPAPVAPTGSPYVVQLKERLVYFPALLNGDAENFFGEVVTSDEATPQIIRVPSPDPSATTARLDVSLQGVTQQAHAVSVALNGQQAGTLTFSNLGNRAASFTIAASLLHDGDNTVTLQSIGGPADVSVVDTIRISYGRLGHADRDELWSRLPARTGVVTFDGFSSPDVRVFDFTDDTSPIELAPRVTAGDATYSASVAAQRATGSNLYAVTNAHVMRPTRIELNMPSRWHDASNRGDVVIVAGHELRDAADQLATLHRSEGHTVAVVDVDDVFDEYSFGERSPQAIKDFLASAYAGWTVKPRYVVLLGDGSLDPKNYFAAYDPLFTDVVPARLVDTSAIETASDDWFVDFDNDGLPELAIGRLPASNRAEAIGIVAKVVSYAGSGGNRSALVVADRNTEMTSFEQHADTVVSLLPSTYASTEVRVGEVGESEARSEVLDALAAGPGIVHYAGHGSVDLWRGNVLVGSDAGPLTNQQRSVMVVANCLNGYYMDPFLSCLGEDFVRAPNGGAVAAWASAGLSGPDAQRVMFERFYVVLFDGSTENIGDAVREAKKATPDRDVRRSWILLGDPLTRVRP